MSGNLVVTPYLYRVWVLWKGVYYLSDAVDADDDLVREAWHTIIPFGDPRWRQVRAEDVPPEVKLQLKLESAA